MKNFLEENEYQLTDNINEALWLFDEDHSLIDGEFDLGMRGLDHNNLISLAPDELTHPEKWSYIHNTYGAVRLVPETMTALIDNKQELKLSTVKYLKYAGYEIEKY